MGNMVQSDHDQKTQHQIEHPWLVAAKEGEQIALQRLLLSQAPNVLEHIAQRLRSFGNCELDADDVLQLTLMDVCRDIRQFQGNSIAQFQAWARTIADHTVSDAMRQLSRVKSGGRFHQQHDVTAGSAQSLIDVLELQQAFTPTPSSCVRQDEAIDAVRVAISKLSNDYRKAVELRYLDGLGLEEVSAIMGRGPRAVQGLLDRARKQLREELQLHCS